MIAQLLDKFKDKFDKEIEIFFDSKLTNAKQTKEESSDMLNVLKKFTLSGGKRIRPALTYYGYQCFSNDQEEELMKACIAIELIQSHILIHDDIIDDDDFRRGKPTVHSIYREYFNDTKIGESIGLICGNLALNLAFELLLSIKKIPALRINEAARHLNETLKKVLFGQELDILSSNEKYVSEEELMLISHLKNSMYTFESSLTVGAMLAGADETIIKSLKNYSLPLGEAFQIQNDISGLFGDEKRIGKPVGSDLIEGKKTLLIIKALEYSNEEEKTFIENILGNDQVTSIELKKLKDIVVQTDSLGYSINKTKQSLYVSKKILENIELNKIGKDFLLNIIEYVEKRNY